MTADTSHLLPWLTLVHTKGLGPGLLRKLLEALGSIDSILGASDSKLRQAGLPEKVVTSLRQVNPANIQTDLDWVAAASDRSIITRDSARYPDRLREIADPPLVLYVRGDADVLATPQLAIVGSRIVSIRPGISSWHRKLPAQARSFLNSRSVPTRTPVSFPAATGLSAASHTAHWLSRQHSKAVPSPPLLTRPPRHARFLRSPAVLIIRRAVAATPC